MRFSCTVDFQKYTQQWIFTIHIKSVFDDLIKIILIKMSRKLHYIQVFKTIRIYVPIVIVSSVQLYIKRYACISRLTGKSPILFLQKTVK